MEPVRGNHNVHFYHAWVEKIDLNAKKLTVMPAYPPAFRQANDPSDQPQLYPNTRGGHGTILTSAPHRRAIESQEDDVSTMQSSMEQEHHPDDGGETWRSMEKGREYTMGFDKLVISLVDF